MLSQQNRTLYVRNDRKCLCDLWPWKGNLVFVFAYQLVTHILT